MVAAAGSRVDTAAGHAFDDFRIGHCDFENEIDGDARGLQGFSLRNGAGEAVKEEALLAVVLREAFLHKADDDVVAYQAALIHNDLSSLAEFGTGLHRGAEHVARGNLRNAEVFFNEGSLRALAGTRRSDENQTH